MEFVRGLAIWATALRRAIDASRRRMGIFMGMRGFSLDAMTMTEAHFEVNGKAEDERCCSGAGCRHWSDLQEG